MFYLTFREVVYLLIFNSEKLYCFECVSVRVNITAVELSIIIIIIRPVTLNERSHAYNYKWVVLIYSMIFLICLRAMPHVCGYFRHKCNWYQCVLSQTHIEQYASTLLQSDVVLSYSPSAERLIACLQALNLRLSKVYIFGVFANIIDIMSQFHSGNTILLWKSKS
jgi:hypothetical protein